MKSLTCHLLLAICLGLLPVTAGRVAAQDGDGRPRWPVYVEDSPAQQEMLLQARSLAQQQRMTESAALYQQMAQAHPHKLTPIDDVRYVDAQVAMRMDVASNPSLLEAYRQLFEAHAGSMLARIDASTDTWPQRVSSLESLMAQYLLTDAGLEAGMRLASLHLEAGHPFDAMGVLDRLRAHPSFDSRAAPWQWLMGAASVFADDDAQAAVHEEALKALHDAAADPARKERLGEMLTALAQWRKTRLIPSHIRATGTTPPAVDAKLPEAFHAPLWQVLLDEDEPQRDGGDQEDEALPAHVNGRRGSEDDKPRYQALPLERDGVVYINQQRAIVAMNANAGQVLWRWELPVSAGMAMRNIPRRLFQPDMRRCAVFGHALAAVVGEHVGMPGRLGAMMEATKLVLLDARDGRLRWQVGPADMTDPPEDLNFHGSPILHQNRVYVLGRRSMMTGFHTQYLFAFDLASGRELWRRHLASTNAPMNQRTIYPLGQMMLHEGRLFVADNLGAVSCVDAMTGQIVWLAHGPRVPVSLASATGRAASPSLLMGCPPVIGEPGLLVAPATPGQVALLLDPRTGLEVRPLDENQWAGADYIIEAGGDIYTIGHRVQCFDGRTLRRKWGVSLSEGRRVNLQGRAAVTAKHLLIPVNNRVLVLDAQTGALVRQPEIAIQGNLLALGSQLIVTGQHRVGGFMSWEDAYERLAARMARSPDDPAPAMALAHLAAASGRPQEMLAAVDSAIAIVNKQAMHVGAPAEAQAVRKALFGQIIELARQAQGHRLAARQRLYDRLAVVTSDLGDEVTCHFLMGELFVEGKDYRQAVSQYQFILNDPSLSQQLHTGRGLSRQAGLEARVRLEKLIEQYGLGVYGQQEQLAAGRLVALTAPEAHASPEALIEIARQFPVSRSAGPALVAAADRLVELGRVNQAISQLRAAYELSGEMTVQQKVIGRLVALYVKQGRLHQARSWLQLASRRDVSPLRDGRPVRAEQWLADIRSLRQRQWDLPAFSGRLSASPVMLQGRLLTPMVSQAGREDRRDHRWFLTATDDALLMRQTPLGKVAWRKAMDGRDVRLALLWSDQTLLWQDSTQTLLSFDTTDGQATWPAVNVGDLYKVLGDAAAKLAARSNPRRQFEAWMDAGGMVIRNGRLERAAGEPSQQVMIVANEMVVCIVDRIGRAVGIDRQTGQPLWTRMLSLDEVHHVTMDDQTLAAAGLTGMRVDAQGGALLLLDPQTGQLQRDAPIEDKRVITWLGMGEQGQVLVSTGQELVAHHPHDGHLLWRLPCPGGQFTSHAGVMGDRLFILDTQGGASLIDLAQGRLISQMSLASSQMLQAGMGVMQGRQAAWLMPAEGDWQVATPSQAMRISRAGQIHWSDGLGHLPGQAIIAQGVSQSRVALLVVPQVQVQEHAAAIRPGVNARRIVIRNNRPQLVEEALEEATPRPRDGVYELLLLERDSGRIVRRQPLRVEGESLQGVQLLMLDEAIVLADAHRTIMLSARGDASVAPPASRD